MLKKPTLFILFFLILIAQTAYSNIKLFPGYYITLNGDSVFCKIEFTDWHRNPATIQVEVNNEKRTLDPADNKGFGVTGYGDYKAATISYHINPTTGLNLPEKFSDR
jgi:hypothetical protein